MSTINKEEDNFSIINKGSKESLEISSTGYGLESVTEESEEGKHNLQQKNINPTCGGL
ncbi:hypothetical protein V7161_29980 [Neobacillus drentensis]|uniref:hypothetical protein n=1 Tax=Bacillales TaxID=1385 RepID=UPI0025B09B4A|nr:hypothetical protein [Paenibacillus sp. BSR1-1]MDN3016124.1 hypothetical protein [Paenibacillus sp. BSR1-1]